MDPTSLFRRFGDPLLALLLAGIFTAEVLFWVPADQLRAVPGALLATLPLALRRRSPLLSFVLVWVGTASTLHFAPGIDNDSVAVIAIFFVSLYSLGRHASAGYERWLGALGVLVYVLFFVVSDGDDFYVGDVAFAVVFVGTPWAIGLVVQLRHEREQVLTARNRQLEREQDERARQAVAAERARIARELHDVVSHAISVTVLQARGGRKMLGVDEDEVRRCLDAIEHTNAQALGDMRRLLSLLRDTEDAAHTDPQPSLARLESLVEHLRSSGLPVELTVTGRPADLPPGVDLSAYRIIQEALTNVLKHAGPAARAKVDVTFGEDNLAISVADDGVPSVNGDGRGHGLIGIRERVAVVGGHVDAGPDESGGFVVRALLPYAVEA